MVICLIVFFESLRTFLARRGYTNKIDTERAKLSFDSSKVRWISLFCWVSLAIYFLTFLKTGVPLLNSMDRASYWKMIEPIPVVYTLLSNFLFISFLIGYCFAFEKVRTGSANLPLIQFALLILFFVLSGNKFSALLALITNFLIVPVFFGFQKSFNWKKVVKWGGLSILFFAGAILIQSSTYSLDGDFYGKYGIFSYLFQRVFILQGEIWWKTYQDIIVNNQFDSNHIWQEIRNVFSLETDGYTGLRYLMAQSAQGDFIYNIIKNGKYLYTGAFPAIILVTFPLIFVLPVLYILGKGFGYIIMSFKRLIFSNSLIRIYLIYIIYKTYNSMILGGAFDAFFIATNIGRILILLAIAILIYDQSNRRKLEANLK
ncbi:DUF6418 domain-containing protein [Reichenbachiella sp.]|uniref:DUF6418 domain-containing protein n=2 Tax=Reichenbachiella sp. TaxID=2184521 RepID=UPI0032631170